MIKAPERVEIPEEEELARDRFARILAVLIVVATLGVACVEYLHSLADKNADSAGVEAQVLSIQRQGELVRADDIAAANVDTFAWADQQRTEEGNAFQEFLAPSVQEGSSQATVLQDEEARWQQLAALTDDLTPVKPGSPYSPANDIAFPRDLVSQNELTADRLFGEEDADNQLRSDWLGRSGELAVILTMLAVAIYLFGLSLTLQAVVRRWLVGLGVVLVVVGLLTTAGLQFFNPSAPPESAAVDYAQGMLALNTFYTQPGDSGLKQADADFTAAIAARPTFAQAYMERSQVRMLLGTPTPLNPVVGVLSPAALQSQGADLDKAYSLGLVDKLVLNNLAANRLLKGISQGGTSNFNEALGYVRQALQLDPNDPLLYFNEGVSYLGLGNLSQAESAYTQAAQHTVYTDVAAKTARNDASAEEADLGGALTVLDLLQSHRSDLKSDVITIKQLLVNDIDHSGAAINTAPSVSQLAVQVFPGELQWTASVNNYDPSKDTISTQWYFEDSSKLGWSVLPSISGPQTPEVDDTPGITYSNPYFLDDRYLKASNQCLQPGHYKVELYVDGHYAGTASSDGTQPAWKAVRMADLAIDFCEPSGWSQDQNNTYVGFSNGYRSSDGSYGAYFIRFQNPQFTSTANPEANAHGYRDYMISYAASENMLPSGAGTPTEDCGQQQSDGTYQLPWGTTLDSSCNVQDAFFLGLDGANEAYYSYNGGYMHIGSGIAPDGAVVIAFTYGPTSEWSSSNESMSDTVFDSIVSTQ